MSGFGLRDTFVHRDGRMVIVSTIVHDPPWSHGIPGSGASYDSETVVWTVPTLTPADVDGRQLAVLRKHSLPGRGFWTGARWTQAAWDRACWERVAEKHAAIVKRARRGRRRAAVTG